MPTKGKAKTQKAEAAPPAKRRSSAPIPDDKWFYPSWFFVNPTLSGIEVNEDTAKRFSAVFGCVKAISETLASIPILTYRRLPNGGKERALTHRVSKLLRLRPNRWQTSSTFRQIMFAHVLTWGNAYAEIVRSAAGDPEELLILHPSLVTVHVSDTGFVYYVVRNPRTGVARVVFKRDMFHLLSPTDDGITGYSPIAAMREGIGLGMAAEAFGARFFGNGATPAAVVEYPGDITPEQVNQFKAKLEELYKGPRKAGKVGVLRSGGVGCCREEDHGEDDPRRFLPAHHGVSCRARRSRRTASRVSSKRAMTSSSVMLCITLDGGGDPNGPRPNAAGSCRLGRQLQDPGPRTKPVCPGGTLWIPRRSGPGTPHRPSGAQDRTVMIHSWGWCPRRHDPAPPGR